MLDWSLLKTPDIAGALNTGFQTGREMRRRTVTDGALQALATNPGDEHALGVLRSVSPEVAWKFEDRHREGVARSALSSVFAPGAGTGVLAQPSSASPQGVLAGGAAPAEAGPAYPPSSDTAAAPPAMQPNAPVVNTAPSTLIDPARLPPRTDGLTINREALQHLYQVDPKSAFEVQKMVHDADESSFKRIQQSGETMAQAAYHLGSINDASGNPDIPARQRELAAMAPQLVAMGLTPEALAQADLSDIGLGRYRAMGRSLKELTGEDRDERRLDWLIQDDRIDNSRADRSESRQEYYRARSDSRSERADGRSAVRFRERDKDRAALAAGLSGIRTDTDDLGY